MQRGNNGESHPAGPLAVGQASGGLNPAQMDQYGWRIAVLAGAVVLPFGFVMRRSLPETLPSTEEATARVAAPVACPPERTGQMRVILCSLAMLSGGTVATYIQNYLTTYTSVILHMQVNLAFGATALCGLIGIPANIMGAMMSERLSSWNMRVWYLRYLGSLRGSTPYLTRLSRQGPARKL